LWLLGATIMVACLSLARLPAAAAPLPQLTPFPTPTPGPDGRILYKVQPGDTLLRISLISGVSLEELRGLNNLTGDNIIVGDVLLLGLGGPSQATPTPGPSPTPTIAPPTPTVATGFGILCVILYDDLNGDSLRQETEASIPGGAISINNRSGSINQTQATVSSLEPQCFEELPEGEYTISVAIPEGYNPTTISSFVLQLRAGDETYLDFGAQVNSLAVANAPLPTDERGRSPILGIAGGLLLLAGVGLALFAGRLLKK